MKTLSRVLGCLISVTMFTPLAGAETPAEVNLALLGRAGANGVIELWGATPSHLVVPQINDGETGWSPHTAFIGGEARPSCAFIAWDKPYRLNRVVVHHGSVGNAATNFVIEILGTGGDPHADGDWQTAFDVRGNDRKVTTHVFETPAVTAGVRLKCPDRRLEIEELEVFGTAADGRTVAVEDHAPPLMHLWPYPVARRLDADVNLRAESTRARGAAARVTIARDGGDAALAEGRIAAFSNVVERVRLDTSALTPGRYRVQARVTIGGREQPPVSEVLEIPAPPEWLGNTIGITDNVPAPWTPLVVDKRDRTISCWGRTYAFKAPVGLSQIDILSEPFLAGPTRFIVRRNGKDTVATGGQWKIIAAGAGKVSFEQNCLVDGVSVKAESWIEFDGLIWTRLTLAGPEVDGVTLELPVRQEMAKLWCEPTWSLSPATGLAPKGPLFFEPTEGVAQRGNFMRLGTEERGIQWCRESLKGWKLGDRSQGFGLIPRGDEYVMQFNFINTPTDLANPVAIEYGWQALPVRPRPTGWRAPYWGGLASRGDPPTLFNEPEVYMYTERWNGRWNYWNHWSEAVFGEDAPGGGVIESFRRQFQDNWALRGEVMNLYCNVAYSDYRTPEYRRYEHDWTFEADRKQVEAAPVCPASESYRDFYVYYLDKSLRALFRGANAPPMGALYFDCPMVWQCNNAAHGCDTVTPVLGARAYMKRIYTAAKAVNPNIWITVHNSGMPWMAVYAFTDIMVEGEQFAEAWEGALRADPSLPADYTRLLTPDSLRAQFHSSLWGPQSMFLCEQWIWYARIKEWGREAHPPLEQSMRHISGLLLAHDILMWGNPSPDPWIQRALRRWGWDDRVEFLPYWSNGTYVTAEAGGVAPVLVSLYRRPAGLLAVVMNDSDTPAAVTLRLDLAALGLADAGFYSAVDVGNPPLKTPRYTLHDGAVAPVPVPARAYVLLQLVN